eukprot:TRINITY_DN12344_c0_g1_i2.p1 TRINITY_DN12344_c0_g1~~TRINITY_DN12344_c0_g1_i2.p1  ORF type:complete len:349 (+),score=49.36 TRINITY_DN12344_c0_g1_i2:369-1415(+)
MPGDMHGHLLRRHLHRREGSGARQTSAGASYRWHFRSANVADQASIAQQASAAMTRSATGDARAAIRTVGGAPAPVALAQGGELWYTLATARASIFMLVLVCSAFALAAQQFVASRRQKDPSDPATRDCRGQVFAPGAQQALARQRAGPAGLAGRLGNSFHGVCRRLGVKEHLIEISQIHVGSMLVGQDIWVSLRVTDKHGVDHSFSTEALQQHDGTFLRFPEEFLLKLWNSDAPVLLEVCGEAGELASLELDVAKLLDIARSRGSGGPEFYREEFTFVSEQTMRQLGGRRSGRQPYVAMRIRDLSGVALLPTAGAEAQPSSPSAATRRKSRAGDAAEQLCSDSRPST